MKQIRWIKEVTWSDIRNQVFTKNPKLAEIIDELDPGPSYKLFQAEYAYGDYIVRDGVPYYPSTTGELRDLEHEKVDSLLKEELTYSTIPLFITLEKANEVFIDTGARLIPLNLFHSGSILGLFETVDGLFQKKAHAIWSVSAGARSIFMLPKINESSGYKKLRGTFSLPPNLKLQNAHDHWNLFRSMASHQNFEGEWSNKVVYFGKKWFQRQGQDILWQKFYHYLIGEAWNQAQFAIEKIELSVLWENFLDALAQRRIKPSPYLASQVRHLMLIGTGTWPGFRPADQSEEIAPTIGFQKAIMNIYELKNYLPSIMHIQPTHMPSSDPIYYSLSFPTVLEGIPYNKSSTTLMLDLREIHLMLDTLQMILQKEQKFKIDRLKKTTFDYFHVENDIFNEIKSSAIIGAEDERFSLDKQMFPEYEFCASSSFWRGCIRLHTS